MKSREPVQHSDRRSVLKFTGLGVLGGWIGNAFSPRAAHASPALAHASWIHGHSMQIEDPAAIQSVWRAGFYIRIEGKSGLHNWFHFAIPTPVIVNDHRLRVGSVMLVFRTMSADAIVRDVHVYDGDVKIAEHNGVNLTGNIGWRRFDVPTHPEVKMGIGISVGVGFGVESMSHRMEFISAGCDFIA